MDGVEARAQEIAASKVAAAEAALAEQAKARRALLLNHSPAEWLYKRGGAVKTWKRRYCCIENGVLYYYVGPADREGGKPALGALVLRNASVRRPTDLTSKGKHKHTCFRIDLDPAVQASIVASVGRVEDEDDDDGKEEAASTKGRPAKAKWILAAENGRSMSEWMEDIAFW